MALNTVALIAKLKEAVTAAPSLTAWAEERGFKHQNVSAILRGAIIPSETVASALGFRRVTFQAYLAPGEGLPLLPPGWEEVEPLSARPVAWAPALPVALDEAARKAAASAKGKVGGPRKAQRQKADAA